MSVSRSESYKAAGVDVTAGYEAVKLMKPMVESTFTKGVMGTLGGFGGLFRPDFNGMKDPILVSGTDGVGTKLKLAFLMDKHDTVVVDLPQPDGPTSTTNSLSLICRFRSEITSISPGYTFLM